MTSSPLPRRRRAAAARDPIPPGRAAPGGFTLLEVLVVVLIIGVVLTVGVLSFKRDALDDLQTEAERLAALLSLATEEAIIGARELALEPDADGYRFAVYADADWQPLEDPVFRPRRLPPDMGLEAFIEGERYPFEAPPQGAAPRILILSSGELTPFEIRLRHPHAQAERTVRGAADGRVEVGE